LQEAYRAWQNAPRIGGLPIILNLPALVIVLLVTALAYIGIKESRLTNNILVTLKVGIILAVLLIGAFFVDPDKWQPFMPNEFSGTMRGVGAVFFAYIGFDALSTTAEEARHPRRDLPLAMLLSLIICTLLYVGLALVLTGTVPYQELGVSDPLAYMFTKLPLSEGVRRALEGVIAVSAVVAMASVLLVFQIGQPRIWFAMSQDGLLPPLLGKVHRRFGTPHWATLLTGLVVIVPLFFSSLSTVVDMTSMGTLMAFAMVSGGVAYLHYAPPPNYQPRFRVPYIPGRWLFPLMVLIGLLWTWQLNPEAFKLLVDFSRGGTLWHYRVLLFFIAVALILIVRYNLSLLPMLGALSALYLVIELGIENWKRLLIWLLIGLVPYGAYGYWCSRLRNP
jgi:amino acid transporter